MKALERGFGFSRSLPAPSTRRARRTGANGATRAGADFYSRTVGLLKRVLPMIGAALLLLVAAWPRLVPLMQNIRLAGSGIDPRAARELKMINPRYAGTDRLNRPFVVTAAVGHQLPERNDLMSLEKPRAVMIVHGGLRVVLTASTAIYQSQPQLLDLFDNVVLAHQNGTRFVTQRAHADLAHSTANGQVPIEGHGPSGDIWGQGFRVLDKGDTIIFTDRAHAILRGTKPDKPKAPPEPPPQVLKAAAAIEVAATAANERQPDPPRAVAHATATNGLSAAPQPGAADRLREGTAPPQAAGNVDIGNSQAKDDAE